MVSCGFCNIYPLSVLLLLIPYSTRFRALFPLHNTHFELDAFSRSLVKWLPFQYNKEKQVLRSFRHEQSTTGCVNRGFTFPQRILRVEYHQSKGHNFHLSAYISIETQSITRSAASTGVPYIPTTNLPKLFHDATSLAPQTR
jgi:hypothetical protein